MTNTSGPPIPSTLDEMLAQAIEAFDKVYDVDDDNMSTGNALLIMMKELMSRAQPSPDTGVLRVALKRLVDLKAHKDAHGKNNWYVRNQKDAWEQAKAALEGASETGIGNHASTAHQQDHALTPSASAHPTSDSSLIETMRSFKFAPKNAERLPDSAYQFNAGIETAIKVIEQTATEPVSESEEKPRWLTPCYACGKTHMSTDECPKPEQPDRKSEKDLEGHIAQALRQMINWPVLNTPFNEVLDLLMANIRPYLKREFSREEMAALSRVVTAIGKLKMGSIEGMATSDFHTVQVAVSRIEEQGRQP